MPGAIYSMTPILLSTTFQDAMNGELLSAPVKMAKALEIDMWLQKHESKYTRYAIIDDEMVYIDNESYYQWIKTDYQTGIDIYTVAHAVDMLNGKPNEMTHEY